MHIIYSKSISLNRLCALIGYCAEWAVQKSSSLTRVGNSSTLSAQLYQKTNTQHRITSAYHPQTNGLTERFNQTLSRCLAKTVNDNQDNWDEKINMILMGYRALRQASIKHSPYFMLFQAEKLRCVCRLIVSRTPEEVIEHLLKSREEVLTSSQHKANKKKRMSAHLAWV